MLAAVFALPVRANVPVAALTTFITNPLTTPPLWVAAYWLGHRILGFEQVAEQGPAALGWLHWLWSEAGPATAVGLIVISAVLTAAGYALSALGWWWWVVRKWKRRHA